MSSQINYTLTYFAEHSESLSHDRIKRYLEEEKLTPTLLWEHIHPSIDFSPNGRLIFDDTVLDKKHSKKIETSQLQYSGNAHGLVQGIGVVTCVYHNHDCDKFWAIDYRIYDKQADGKSKLDHLKDMLASAAHSKNLPFSTVLMDSWYATVNIMYTVHNYEKIFYCPIKSNRQVSRTDIEYQHIPAKDLPWTASDLKYGQRIHLAKTHNNFHV